MKIVSLKTKTKEVKDFKRQEWGKVHKEHFGTEQDENLWKKRKFTYKAETDKRLVGVIKRDFVAGVMYIGQLIVKSDKRGQGIGKALMEKAGKLARENKLHKIYLKTGSGWKAVRFYESLGYAKEAKIKNLYEYKDFWIMTKELEN